MSQFYEFSHLSLSLDSKVIFKDLSLQLQKGSFNSLIGISGAGKTQILDTIAGLNAPLLKSPFSNLKINFAFQNNPLIPWITVRKNLEIVAPDEADHLLQLVGLKVDSKVFPHQLSGGMQQRLNLARAFSGHPDLVLLDEPFTSLDYYSKISLYKELLDHWRKTKTTVLFVTHDISEAVYLSKRVHWLSIRTKNIVNTLDIDHVQKSEVWGTRTPIELEMHEKTLKFLQEEYDFKA